MAHRALQLLANEPAQCERVSASRSRVVKEEKDMKAIVIRHYGGPEVLEYGELPIRSGAETSGQGRRGGDQSNRHHGALWSDEGFQADAVFRACSDGTSRDRSSASGPGPRFLARRQGARLGLPHLRRALRRQGGASRQDPGGLDLVEAAALPLVTTTGDQLVPVAGE